MGDQGTLTLQTSADSEDIRITIRDTGRGIPADQQSGLFEPSFTRRGKRIKAGMGLFTSRNIVDKHHGQINFESREGEGSTFTVILPCAGAAAS